MFTFALHFTVLHVAFLVQHGAFLMTIAGFFVTPLRELATAAKAASVVDFHQISGWYTHNYYI